MISYRIKQLVVILAVEVLLYGGAVIGEEGAQAGKEAEVLVTASRDTRQASEVPANVTVITSGEIQQADCVSIVDALENLGGVYIRSITGNPATSEVGMRGFGENSSGRVLVLLDGQRLNGPDMAGINWLQIPVNNIERIEIVRGSGSVLYGDSAVAGVINVDRKSVV